MATKRPIIYESDEEDDEDRTKKSRTVPYKELALASTEISDGAGVRRSGRSGKGNGGRLAQMKQIERMQTETSKRPSKLDIATQGEDVNPMAPSFQDDGERFRRSGSDGTQPYRQATLTQSHSQTRPEFVQAAPGQKFGFRVPEVMPQTRDDMRAPIRNRFSGASSQISVKTSTGKAPSSHSASLFSGRPSGTNSTLVTSRAPSMCSSTGGRRHHEVPPPSCVSRISNGDDAPSPQSSLLEHSGQDPAFESVRNPSGLQQTAASYGASVTVNRSGCNFSAVPIPGLYDTGSLIDENSPSDDDRIAEQALHGTGPSRPSVHDNEGSARPSPSPDFFTRLSPSRDDSDNEIGAATESNDQAPVQRFIVDDGEGANTNLQRRQTDPSAPRPRGDPVSSPPPLPVQLPENVLSIHRRRNRAPRLPSNPQLLVARQRQAGHAVANNEAAGQAVNADDDPDHHLALPPAKERSEPWQLQYYDPPTRDVIERAKQFAHSDAASINPFPIRPLFNSKAIEYINEAIAERRDRGLVVSDRWWPHHASNITRLLWEDLGNWRSSLRKKARTFVTQRYQWDPENRRERNIGIAKNLLDNGGLFLRDGTDDEGHVNNLAHPALSGLVIDFFYTGPAAVGKLFPEVFSGEVPRVAVALAAMAIKVVLDEIASGQGEVNFRVHIYSPVFTEILGLMSKCDTSAVHRTKTKALRMLWAEHGSNGMANPEPVAGGCGFDVSLD